MPGPGLSRDIGDEGHHIDRPDRLQEMLQLGKLMTLANEIEPAMVGLRRRFKDWRAWNLDLQQSRTLLNTTLMRVKEMRDAAENVKEVGALRNWYLREIKRWQEEFDIMSETLIHPLASTEDKKDDNIPSWEVAKLRAHLMAVERLTAARKARLTTVIRLRMTWMINKRTGRLSRWRVSLSPPLTEPLNNLTKRWVMLDLRMQLYFRLAVARTDGASCAIKLMKIYCGSGKLSYGGRATQYFLHRAVLSVAESLGMMVTQLKERRDCLRCTRAAKGIETLRRSV